MSDNDSSQVTTEEPQVDETLITTDPAETDSGGPKPLYEDKETEEKVEEETAEEEKPKEDEESDEGEDDGEDKKPEEGETKEYDSLEKPKESLLSDADMERILENSLKEGLSKEAAQKQVEIADSVLQSNAQRVADAHSELSERWIQECRDDKEIGGEKFEESITNANKAINKFGTDDFKQSLRDTKFGNNPEVVRVFARIGRAMSPDEFIRPGHEPATERTMEDIFYGNSKN